MAKSNPPSLRELQVWMRWVLTDPRGVEGALADPHPRDKPARYQAPPFDLTDVIQPSLDRLDIYAEGYFSRLLDTLAESFPRTRRHLGEEDFSKLIAEYLKVYPSDTPDIDQVGRHLPQFCEGYLHDLLLAEWNAGQSRLESPPPNADLKLLTELGPEEWPRVRLHLHPDVRLQESGWDLTELWQGREAKQKSAPETYLIRGQTLTALPGFEAKALQMMQKGRPLSDLMEALAEGTEPDQVSEAFGRWVHEGLIHAVTLISCE